MNHILCTLPLPATDCESGVNQGYHFGVKNKVFCMTQKTIAHEKKTDYNVWNQNIAKLSLIFIALYHYEEAKSDTHPCVADTTQYNIHFYWGTSDDVFSFEFIKMDFYTYISMY